MKYFSTNDLPLNDEMIKFWNDNGYLVIENFNTDKECDELMERSSYLIEHNNFNNQKSIFDTVNTSRYCFITWFLKTKITSVYVYF